MRTWRLEAIRSARTDEITSYRLIAGRGDDRQRVPLGNLTAAQAEECLASMIAEEKATFGTKLYDRLLRLSAEMEAKILASPIPDELGIGRLLVGKSAVVRLLMADPGALEIASMVPKNYLDMTVSEYFEQVYWPARIDPKSIVGISEANAATEFSRWKQGEFTALGVRKERRGILDSDIGRMRMRDLNDVAWEHHIQQQVELSPRSKAIRRTAYSVMLRYARQMGHIKYQPEFFPIKGSTKTTQKKQNPITLAEVVSLLNSAQSPMHRCMWGVAIGTGVRPSELVRIHWEDVKFDDQTIEIRGTKTEASADEIPLTPLALRELKTYHSIMGGPTFGRVFLHAGKPFLNFKNSLKNDAKRAGITRPVTPYLLRHSFATISFLLGLDKDLTRRIGRWTSTEMLDKVYARPKAKDWAEKLREFALPATLDDI